MKRKNFFYGGVMALMMAFSMSACSESDDPKPDTGGTGDPTNLVIRLKMRMPGETICIM